MTEQVIEYVSKIDSKKRQAVIEITLDMALLYSIYQEAIE
jgi:hypothetical protein